MEKWIQNKRCFIISLLFFFFTMVLLFPFPHRYVFGEIIFDTLHLPISLENGLQLVSIAAFIFLIIGIFLLTRSITRFKGTMTLMLIIFTASFPSSFAGILEKHVAKGIYAVEYDSFEGRCEFTRIEDLKINAACSLPFTNHSEQETTFDITFSERGGFFEPALAAALNEEGPFQVTLKGDEFKQVKINTVINLKSGFSFDIDSTSVGAVKIHSGHHVKDFSRTIAQ